MDFENQTSQEEMLLRSIDAGKGFIKSAYLNKDGKIIKNRFKSKYSEKSKDGAIGMSGNKAFSVTYDGKDYDYGLHGTIELRKDGTSKLNDSHRIAMLIALALTLPKGKEKGEKINVVLSMPSANYTKQGIEAHYKEFYMGEKDISITVNGIDYEFTINDIMVMPEGYGFIINYPNELKGHQLIMDIGHLNMQFLLLEDGDVKKMLTTDKGGYELERHIREEFTMVTQNTIDERYIFDIISDGGVRKLDGTIDEDSIPIISKICNDYIDDVIIKEIIDLNINLGQQNKIFAIGGTSVLIKKFLLDHAILKDRIVVSDEGEWETVVGNLLAGKVHFG